MRTLHIANIDFETELTQHVHTYAPQYNPISLQLQYLPFLYADANDGVAVSCLSSSWPKQNIHLLTDNIKDYDRIESWGASQWISKWAKQHNIPYSIPPWDVIQTVNSKAFSFQNAPPLPQATLLHNKEQSLKWLQDVQGPKVLKTCYGVSGKGHLIIDAAHTPPLEKILLFLQKEWDANRPVIAEPWVERLLDFSTQWEIPLKYIGATICENNTRGQYRSNRVGKVAIPFLEEHKQIALPILHKMQALGFYGNVGIDAMLYKHKETGNTQLHPVVEINARKTMGWIALALQQKHFPDKQICFSYLPAHEGLLPSSIQLPSGKTIAFTRNLLTVECSGNG